MITRFLFFLLMAFFLTILALFGYIIILLNFLFWNHKAIQHYILDPEADWSLGETFGCYETAWEKAWRKA